MERCLREIAAVEAELRAGNSDVAGLLLALADWHAELRILEIECLSRLDVKGSTENRAFGTCIGRD
jgi:hypothetical protein